jgi:threonine/homoserine/homoserine lactone efflux protein
MSALLNPKNAVFYLSLFTVMVSPETPLEMRAVYGLWMTGVVLAWDVIIASVLSAEKVKQKLGRWIFFLEKAAGALLAFFGIMLTL